MSYELKPCPFCGGEAETWSNYFDEKDMTLWQVRCKERPYAVEHPCYTADSFVSFTTEAEAVEAWNTRAERTCTFSKCEKSGDPYPTCSACGYETDLHECEWYMDDAFEYEKKFCPNCGARVMEVE